MNSEEYVHLVRHIIKNDNIKTFHYVTHLHDITTLLNCKQDKQPTTVEMVRQQRQRYLHKQLVQFN